MIIKSYNLSEIKNNQSNFYLFYGENEGHKEEVINTIFLKGFKGELIKYDENQVLEYRNTFFEVCLNESLFEDKKIIIISRVTQKLYEIINELSNKKLNNKKIILKSSSLEKKSKFRQLFEKSNELVCVAFYQDNSSSLFKIANDFFRLNKISISSENINLIVEKCAGDRKNLQNEMNKILNFCFNKNKINQNEILKLINLYEDENYFELIDGCLSKNHKTVSAIINSSNYRKEDGILLIRLFISRIKRLIELKKLQKQFKNSKETINNFKPPIFWKDKEIVQKQVEIWSSPKIYELLDKVNNLEIILKKNANLSNNLVYDLLLNVSNN